MFFAFLYIECRPLFESNSEAFTKNADYKLSRTYDNVIAIALQCISIGNVHFPETAYYADTYFTFKQANEMTGGPFRYVYGSQNFSTATWKADDNKGIQLSSISMISHWNPIHCDVANITTSMFFIPIF